MSAATMTRPFASEERPSAVCVDLALNWLDEHLMQLHSLSVVLERQLREMCEEEKDRNPPLVEWRLAQILNDMLASSDVQDGISNILRKRHAATEVQQ